jgi:hypothetical protein
MDHTFDEGGPVDMGLRYVIGLGLLLYIFWYGTVFEATYSPKFVELYSHPWWRATLLGFVLLLAYWCPRVGLIAGLALLLYFSDMKALTMPLIKKPVKQVGGQEQ